MEEQSEIRKVDSQGRIVLPLEWRESDLKPSNEVIIIKYKGYLKILPRRKGKLSEFFDKIEFEDEVMQNLEDWTETEKKIYKLDDVE
jgi:bifunctional DNA-binding transcriptional regulator/antitoxin component of YhaV-PrlF toxin-antitoxin module